MRAKRCQELVPRLQEHLPTRMVIIIHAVFHLPGAANKCLTADRSFLRQAKCNGVSPGNSNRNQQQTVKNENKESQQIVGHSSMMYQTNIMQNITLYQGAFVKIVRTAWQGIWTSI